MKNIRHILLSIIIACQVLGANAAIPDTQTHFVPWNKGAFQTNNYRNLFVEMGYSKKQIKNKLNEVFNGVFYGPYKVYFEVGDSTPTLALYDFNTDNLKWNFK